MSHTELPSFGQAEPTDGRERGDWKSRYTDPVAIRGIKVEFFYLIFLLLTVPVVILVLWLELPRQWLNLPADKYDAIFRYGLAWASGALGGTLFDIKWFYHVVARNIWNLDRRYWRIFTPHVSGCLAFAVAVLISSGVIRIFDGSAINNRSLLVGFSFLVGYFSDSAAAKLYEIAETLFGTSLAREKHKDPKGADDGTKR